jgi:hypothetical protein
MKRTLVTTLGLLTVVTANGSETLPGTLSQPHFLASGIVVVYTDGQRSGSSPCTSPGRYSLNAMTPEGKIQLSGLLTAYAAGRRVGIVGSGACSSIGDETINYFYIED